MSEGERRGGEGRGRERRGRERRDRRGGEGRRLTTVSPDSSILRDAEISESNLAEIAWKFINSAPWENSS